MTYKIFTIACCLLASATSCGKNANSQPATDPSATALEAGIDSITPDGHHIVSKRTIFSEELFSPDSAFIVISKRDLDLSVYASIEGDTVLIARYPVCLSQARGQKEKKGDMRTPESWPGAPFSITQIQPASTWVHDFGDGRGSIKAYGDWFLRLRTPGHSGIGIHGSTNNESSVPGRASEGCIRLLDPDIIHLRDNYARVGMPVIIKQEGQGNLPFETH